ncbi:hypothetical protein KIH87_05165 [Paraneptunicella aestuarii]|uniref:hypothetical protein n=1 Tax=Paraneptunicella aestuarii TaxID=2831148 RepID=UPI001E5C92C4|nr:hypothetical protein [Paraneptunicella aestuarii]UAA39751.1 hypothetical protein KIH87_05165 [Paraneptunicella aestuarii]
MKKLITVLIFTILNQTSFAQTCPSMCGNGTVVGEFTPNSALSGGSNVFMGAYAGSSTTTGSSNTFVGQLAGYRNQAGNRYKALFFSPAEQAYDVNF